MERKPPALIEVAIEPKTLADETNFVAALKAIVAEASDIEASFEPAGGQTILKVPSWRHVDQTANRLAHEFGVNIRVGAPQVAYRETLTKKVEIDYTHKKQNGGSGQFARLKIIFEPLPPGSGYAFESEITGGTIPKEYVPGVEKGLNASRENGVVAGFPLIDFKATLVDGAFHEMDSNVLTFEIAARAAFRELKERQAVKLLEPIMKVELVTPDEFSGGVISDLNARRGRVTSTEALEEYRVVALVPLATLFHYDEELSALTCGRGTAKASFSHYEEVPRSIFDDDPPPFPPAIGMRA
jgi:elongation factor G